MTDRPRPNSHYSRAVSDGEMQKWVSNSANDALNLAREAGEVVHSNNNSADKKGIVGGFLIVAAGAQELLAAGVLGLGIYGQSMEQVFTSMACLAVSGVACGILGGLLVGQARKHEATADNFEDYQLNKVEQYAARHKAAKKYNK